MTEISILTIESQVIDVVAKMLRIDRTRLRSDTNLPDDLGTDSLDALNIILQLEEVFKVTIPDNELHRYQTIGDIAAAVNEHLNQEVQQVG